MYRCGGKPALTLTVRSVPPQLYLTFKIRLGAVRYGSNINVAGCVICWNRHREVALLEALSSLQACTLKASEPHFPQPQVFMVWSAT